MPASYHSSTSKKPMNNLRNNFQQFKKPTLPKPAPKPKTVVPKTQSATVVKKDDTSSETAVKKPE